MNHTRPAPAHPDKETVKGRLLEICSYYLGPGKTVGARTSWVCPGCEKRKFEAEPVRGVAGCWNASCPVPAATDAVGVIAFFEDLDEAADFQRILRRGADLVPALEDPPARPPRPPENPYPDDPELVDAVYRALLAACPLSRRDHRYWRNRGLEDRVIRRARLASTTYRRTRRAAEKLAQRFGRERLLSVPGFFENRSGRPSFTIAGDYALIPYHDAHGRVSTVEGRFTGGPVPGSRLPKYLSPRGSAPRLYVFPGFAPDNLLAFCEGPVGAIAAAQEGLPVGAIRGLQSHGAPGGGPLPELAGADLGGRLVPYIPDADKDPAPPKLRKEVEKAARSLAGPHDNAAPALARLPRSSPAGDLDEWLLSLPKARRRRAFFDLLAAAAPLPRAPR